MARTSTAGMQDIERLRRGNRGLVIAMLVIVVIMLGAVLFALIANLVQRQTPRTLVERQLVTLERVVQEKPTSEEAWADYLLALVAAKQYSKAEATLARAEKTLGTDVVDLLYVRARLAAARGDRQEALALVDEAIAAGLAFRTKELERLAAKGTFIDPHAVKGKVLASAYYLKAQLLAVDGAWQEVVEVLDRALEENPTSADALVLRGNAHLELSETASATADFRRALEFIPDHAPALEGLKKAGADQ